MATTSFQDLARQLNARKSTGPVTDDGKARSAVNSTKHGFAGSGAILTPEIVAELAARRAMLPLPAPTWDTVNHQLETDWLLAGIRLDLCRDARARLIRDQWELDHLADAEDVARQLPKLPGLVTLQLERGRHGVDWKIARWRYLLDQLDKERELTGDELGLLYDLLGTPQRERVAESGPDDVEDLRKIAQHEIRRLEGWRDSVLVPNEKYERISAEMGIPDNETKALRLLRRYERELENKLRRLTERVNPFNVTMLPSRMSTRDTCPRPNGAEKERDLNEVASAMFDAFMSKKKASAQASPDRPDVNTSTVVSAPSRDEAGDQSCRTEGSRQPDATPSPVLAPSRDEAGDRSCGTEGSRQTDAPSVTTPSPVSAPSRDEAGDRSRQREESRQRKERRKRDKASRRRSRQNR